MKYTEKDVASLIAQVEEAFTAQLAKAEDLSLAKSEDAPKEHEEKEEHKEKPEHEAHDAKEEKPEAHEEKHDAKPEHEEKPAQEEHHGEEAHDYDQEDMEHMEKMYRSMSKGELAAHHGCIQKCMGKSEAKPAEMSKNEAEGYKNGGEISASAPKDVPGAKSEASDAHGDKMEKSENQEVELLKSELAAEKAAKDDLKKNYEAVQEFLTKLVKKTAPQGKAITSLDVVAKSEAAVEEKKLNKADQTLKKSDRDAITSYYLNGQVNVNSISHLLK
jgi:hypothetical protein